jgi:2-oxoglutarate ferredoxin oxidoreductase subunit gamma
MSQEAYQKYSPQMKRDGILIIDQSLVSPKSTDPIQTIYRFDFTKVARKNFNLEIVANMIALGAVIHLLKFIPKESTLEALSQRVPPKFLAVNQKAFELGISIAREVTI